MKILDLQSTSDLTKVVNYLGSEDSKKIISACIKKIVLSNLIKTKDKPFYKQLEFIKPITIFYSLEGNKFYFNKVKDEKKTFLFDDLLKLSAIDLSKKIMSSERKNEIAETCYRVLLRLEEEFNSIEKQSQDLILKELSIFKVGLRNTVDNVTKPERDYGFVFKRGAEILFEKIDKIEEMAI